MLSLAEAARLKADNHLGRDECDTTPAMQIDPALRDIDGRNHPFNYERSGDVKRRRRSVMEDVSGLQGAMPVQRGSQKHAYKDPIELGLLTETRGKALFES